VVIYYFLLNGTFRCKKLATIYFFFWLSIGCISFFYARDSALLKKRKLVNSTYIVLSLYQLLRGIKFGNGHVTHKLSFLQWLSSLWIFIVLFFPGWTIPQIWLLALTLIAFGSNYLLTKNFPISKRDSRIELRFASGLSVIWEGEKSK